MVYQGRKELPDFEQVPRFPEVSSGRSLRLVVALGVALLAAFFVATLLPTPRTIRDPSRPGLKWQVEEARERSTWEYPTPAANTMQRVLQKSSDTLPKRTQQRASQAESRQLINELFPLESTGDKYFPYSDPPEKSRLPGDPKPPEIDRSK